MGSKKIQPPTSKKEKALFDTFSARYSYSGIKFEFSEQFPSKKHII